MAHRQIHIEQMNGSFRATNATIDQVVYAFARLIATMPGAGPGSINETPAMRNARTVCALLGHELPRDCSTI